jgi:hypothetical protein
MAAIGAGEVGAGAADAALAGARRLRSDRET